MFTSSPEPEMLKLIGQLLSEFDSKSIRYVHWKSNTNIAKALAGIDDLDILVHPDDRKTAELIFVDLDLLRARSAKDDWQDDLYHFVGMDIESCKAVHVHVHYALPIGFDYDKNFVLPVVEAYLATRWKHGPVYLPEVEMEYAILVLRLIIKNGPMPFALELPHRQLQRFMSAKDGVISGGGLAEFRDLAARSDRERLTQVLATAFAFVKRSTFDQCEATIARNASLLDYFRSALILGRELRPFAKNSSLSSFSKASSRINGERFVKLTARLSGLSRARKKLVTGGRIIAFVGGDGAGKSTNVDALYRSLSRELAAAKLHIGRPPRSALGLMAKVVARAMKFLGAQTYWQAFSLLSTALDRNAAFKRGRSLREQGRLVVIDRVPLPGITRMDCPRIHLVAGGRFKRLAAWESALHREIAGLDVLIVLKLDPQIALQRRPEDDAEELLRRSGEVWNDCWLAPYATVIDTGVTSPLDVQRQVLEATWKSCSSVYIRGELVGLSGVGKSSLIGALRERIPNLTHSLPYWRYPVTTLIGAMLGIPTALRAFERSRNREVATNCLQLFAAARLLRMFRRSGFPATNFILDQGPVFQYALARQEEALSSRGDSVAREACRTLKAVLLSASRDTIFLRVSARQNHVGRVPVGDRPRFEAFCDSYERELNAAAAASAGITSIDTEGDLQLIVQSLLSDGALR